MGLNKVEACPGGGGGGNGKQNRSLSGGGGGGGGAGIYKSVSGDIINACSVVLNPGGGGGCVFAIIVIHRGVLLDNGIARQLLPALHGYLC